MRDDYDYDNEDDFNETIYEKRKKDILNNNNIKIKRTDLRHLSSNDYLKIKPEKFEENSKRLFSLIDTSCRYHIKNDNSCMGFDRSSENIKDSKYSFNVNYYLMSAKHPEMIKKSISSSTMIGQSKTLPMHYENSKFWLGGTKIVKQKNNSLENYNMGHPKVVQLRKLSRNNISLYNKRSFPKNSPNSTKDMLMNVTDTALDNCSKKQRQRRVTYDFTPSNNQNSFRLTKYIKPSKDGNGSSNNIFLKSDNNCSHTTSNVNKTRNFGFDLYKRGIEMMKLQKVIRKREELNMNNSYMQFTYKPTLNKTFQNKNGIRTIKQSHSSIPTSIRKQPSKIDNSIYDRHKKWKRQISSEMNKRKVTQTNEQMISCTFNPVINKTLKAGIKRNSKQICNQQFKRKISNTKSCQVSYFKKKFPNILRDHPTKRNERKEYKYTENFTFKDLLEPKANFNPNINRRELGIESFFTNKSTINDYSSNNSNTKENRYDNGVKDNNNDDECASYGTNIQFRNKNESNTN